MPQPAVDASPQGIIALDFDGTLLRSDETISPRTQAALTKASEAGWLVVGATGRPTRLADLVSDQVPAMRFVVNNNGSMTIDTQTGEVLAEVVCSAEAAAWGCSVIRAEIPDAGMVLDQTNGGQAWESGFETRVSNKPMGAMVDDVVDHIQGPVRKLLVMSDSVSVDDMVLRLGPLLAPRLDVTFSGLNFIDVGPPGVSKASALAELAERFAVPPTRTYAFGDARNDHEMLLWAGTGVAMGNAMDETKAVADAVTASNDDDGIAAFIEAELLS